jgi:pimeloyl-ACP methyl ester carboxylesterase
MSVTPDHTDELLQIAGTHIQVLKGGAGEPLLVLHGAGGDPMVSQDVAQKLRFYDPTQALDDDAEVNRQLTPAEEAVQWRDREMTSRLCWKPYFHNPKLPAYLRGMKVPTLIVWGKYGAIIPLNCGEIYQQALPNSRLRVIDRCGHSPALEKPQEFLSRQN